MSKLKVDELQESTTDSNITVASGTNLVVTDSLTVGGAAPYTVGGTDVAVADGGTNLSSYTVGDVLYASGTTALSKLAASTDGHVLTSTGAGSAPAWEAAGGGGLRGFARCARHGSNSTINSSTPAELHSDYRTSITPTASDSILVIQVEWGISVDDSKCGMAIYMSTDSGSTWVDQHSGESYEEMFRIHNGSGRIWNRKTITWTFTAGNTNARMYTPFWRGYGSSGDNLGDLGMIIWEVAP